MQLSHKQVQNDVDALIVQHLKARQKQSSKMHKDYEFLLQSISSLYLAGGKRLRPFLFVLAYQAYGGKKYHQVLPIAASVELLHCAMLVHDDVIDRDYLRHGKKNIAGMYQERYAEVKNVQTDHEYLANNTAILAGDLLLSDTYQLVIDSNIADLDKIRVMKFLGKAVDTTVGGQLLDNEAGLFHGAKTDSVLIATYKTSYYSFTLPLLLGSMLAGSDVNSQKDLVSIGTSLGIAFQIADDLQGIFGVSSHTGKPDFGDLREGKQTYLLQTTMELATLKQKNMLNSIIGNPKCDKKMSQNVQNIMTETGAKTAVEQKIQSYTKQAKSTINKLQIDDKHKKLLVEFTNQAIK